MKLHTMSTPTSVAVTQREPRKAVRTLVRQVGTVALAALVALAGSAPAYAAKVPAGPAPLTFGTLYASGVTLPLGQLWLGSHLWVVDHAAGFCRLDPAAAPVVAKVPAAPFAKNAATCNQTSAAGGQPAFDPATGSVYIPDVHVRSPGLARLSFSPASETVGSPALVSPGALLAGIRTTAAAVGPDGNLYVGAKLSGTIFRVSDPAGAAPSIAVAGATSDGKGLSGLTFVGADLYLAEGGKITVLANAPACGGSCIATPVTAVAGITALTSDGLNTLYIASTPFIGPSTILRYTISSATQVVLATSGAAGIDARGRLIGATPFQNAHGLGLDGAGNLFVGDDPSNGGAIGLGRIFMVKPVP